MYSLARFFLAESSSFLGAGFAGAAPPFGPKKDLISGIEDGIMTSLIGRGEKRKLGGSVLKQPILSNVNSCFVLQLHSHIEKRKGAAWFGSLFCVDVGRARKARQ